MAIPISTGETKITATSDTTKSMARLKKSEAPLLEVIAGLGVIALFAPETLIHQGGSARRPATRDRRAAFRRLPARARTLGLRSPGRDFPSASAALDLRSEFATLQPTPDYCVPAPASHFPNGEQFPGIRERQ